VLKDEIKMADTKTEETITSGETDTSQPENESIL